VKIKSNKCLLCGATLKPSQDCQRHPDAIDCDVRFTDEWGVAIEAPEREQFRDALIQHSKPFVVDMGDSNEPEFFQTFPPVDEVLGEIFAQHQLPYLGGVSSGRGWSSVSTFERCWYLWKQRYLERGARPSLRVESPSLAIGILVHMFLALHYTGMMDEASPYRVLTPEAVYDRVKLKANPEFVGEAWRVFQAYRLYYMHDVLIPLAVELNMRDPRTGESCRYDLIAFVPKQHGELSPGTYIVDHKTGSRFDDNFLNGWQNDGEIIGQVALWQKLGLEKRFGPLKGTIMNLCGKQKEPKFHRTIVAPNSWRVRSHLDDLRRVEGLINLAVANDMFPRSRANCINRYGKCDLYEHCASAEADQI
jgi:hypothetical protein